MFTYFKCQHMFIFYQKIFKGWSDQNLSKLDLFRNFRAKALKYDMVMFFKL